MDNNYQNNGMNNPNENMNTQNQNTNETQPQAGAFTQQYAQDQAFGTANENAAENATMNGDAPQGEPVPEKPKKKKGIPLWLSRSIFAVVIAAIAVGGGYAGASMAYQNVERIVVDRVTTTVTSDGTSETATSASSALSATEIAAKTEPSVVSITTERMTTSSYWFGSQVESGAGSGVIITGWIYPDLRPRNRRC